MPVASMRIIILKPTLAFSSSAITCGSPKVPWMTGLGLRVGRAIGRIRLRGNRRSLKSQVPVQPRG